MFVAADQTFMFHQVPIGRNWHRSGALPFRLVRAGALLGDVLVVLGQEGGTRSGLAGQVRSFTFGLFCQLQHFAAMTRMNLLQTEASSFTGSVGWLHLSSLLFGTCMVHCVVVRQLEVGEDGQDNPWLQAFFHNFGEVLDRVKLYAILQQNE